MELKPCPWCGVIPTIKWEEWKEISPTCGVYRLEAEHLSGCYIRSMNGMNLTGAMIGNSEEYLAEIWNRRKADV